MTPSRAGWPVPGPDERGAPAAPVAGARKRPLARHPSRRSGGLMPAGGAARSGFWTERTVAWYRRAAERGDYAERVLEVIAPRLEGCRDALDVGAGCGALAIPLARRLERVTALEPTPAMAEGLRAWARDTGLANIAVIEAAWGEASVAPHDVVLCAHVGGLLGADSPFLREVGRVARRLVALVRDAPASQRDDKFFFGELYPALLGRPYEHRCDAEETLASIRALGLAPAVTAIEYVSDQPFADLEEACDFWMTYMGLEGDAARAYLRRFLAERLTRQGGEWVAPYRKSALILAWEPAHAATSSGRQ